jgi:hypothetical protein
MTYQGPPPDAARGEGVQYDLYINWHAQGSADKGIPPATFSARASGSGQPPLPCPQLATGVIWDIENIETGWQNWPKGGAKEYRANPAPQNPLPYPGAGFSENIRIPMAIDPNTTALWDQASTGAWKGFCEISAVIAQQHAQNPGLLPVIAHVGATLTSTGQNSTQVPNFQIVSWVARPPCLAIQAQAPAQPPAAGYAPAPAAAPAAWGAPLAAVPATAPLVAAPAAAWGATAPPADPPADPNAPLPPTAAPPGAWNT